MAAELGLDYFGVDHAVDEAGNIVVFEANCCFQVLSPDLLPVFTATVEMGSAAPYQHRAIGGIQQALGELLRRRAGR
jgi:hypothetical protein